MARKTKNEKITIDDVHGDMLTLFHKLIQRVEKLTSDCTDTGALNQILKTTTDFLIKINKEKDDGSDENINDILRQTLKGLDTH